MWQVLNGAGLRARGSVMLMLAGCSVLVAVGSAAAESGAKRGCQDHIGTGSSLEIGQNRGPCARSRPGKSGQREQSPKRTLDLPGATAEDLLARVRTFNPELAAAALDREAAVAKIYPAGALDDPTVNLTRDQGFRQTLLTVSQDFPLWGKRRVREEVAEANATAARGREGGVKAELEEQVKMVFAQYYEAAQAIRITRDIRGLLQGVAGSARARYAQGLGNQSD